MVHSNLARNIGDVQVQKMDTTHFTSVTIQVLRHQRLQLCVEVLLAVVFGKSVLVPEVFSTNLNKNYV